MQHLTPTGTQPELPLFSAAQSRDIEQAITQQGPAHTLMGRAARAVVALGSALYPHARQVWFACGPGNNGGDGLWAAALWQQRAQASGVRVSVTWLGKEERLPEDAKHALQQAQAAGVAFVTGPPADADLWVDALLGLGLRQSPTGALAAWCDRMQQFPGPVLCVDLPSGLDPDSGDWPFRVATRPRGPRHTLCLLTLKPGLFSGAGREATGDLWFDDLGIQPNAQPLAQLYSGSQSLGHRRDRHHAHKGTHGDVVVWGGQGMALHGQGMTGAALLASRAALRAGAGRVFVALLEPEGPTTLAVDTLFPELMFRRIEGLLNSNAVADSTSVCGCGGGMAVDAVVPVLLNSSPRLVLDADALNRIAARPELQTALRNRRAREQTTVITPHPLEAARLLGSDTAGVQRDRLGAAQALSDRFQCTTVLKGSGTVVAAPDTTPVLHMSGNALLATAGTGDVLAGWIGSVLAQTTEHPNSFESVCGVVHQHGRIADTWTDPAFTAGDLIAGIAAR